MFEENNAEKKKQRDLELAQVAGVIERVFYPGFSMQREAKEKKRKKKDVFGYTKAVGIRKTNNGRDCAPEKEADIRTRQSALCSPYP